MKRVLGLLGHTRRATGSDLYRVTMPLAHLDAKSRTWRAAWMPAQELRDRAPRADVVLLGRLDATRPDLVDALFAILRGGGARLVYDVDDDLTNQFRVVTDRDPVSFAAACDAVTVTTPHLAGLMGAQTGLPCHILPNCLDPAVWTREPPPRSGPLVLALTGSRTHDADWAVLAEVFPRLLKHYNILLLVMGGVPDYLQGLGDRVVLAPFARYDQYARVIQKADVVLCPLDPDDSFNLSKSPIKALEGMAARRLVGGQPAGACVLASRMPVYEAVIDHGVNGWLVEHTPAAWEQALKDILFEQDQREQVAQAAHRWVWQHYNIQSRWAEWQQVYEAVLEGAITPSSCPQS